MTDDLLMTVGILAAALVYITKTALDYVIKRKNGKAQESSPVQNQLEPLVKDLHDWHAPIVDSETGQPKFLWYVNVQDLRADIAAIAERLEEIEKLLSSDQP